MFWFFAIIMVFICTGIARFDILYSYKKVFCDDYEYDKYKSERSCDKFKFSLHEF